MSSIDHSHMGAMSDSELLQALMEHDSLRLRRDATLRAYRSQAMKIAETLADGISVPRSDIVRYQMLRKAYRRIQSQLEE